MTVVLDTNFLIGALTPGTPQDRQLRQWLTAGEAVRISVIVWFEFLCGPAAGVTPDQVRLAAGVVGEPEALSGADASRGAELFNATGRRRGSFADCLIAATALRLGATVATANVDDFRRFAPMGLQIASAASP
jgi:predicted nucleic acid-binding protein